MSVEFRQRTPGEYAQIIWRRKWLIVLPAIAIATAIAWVVLRLPNVYESTTLLIVKPPTISTSYIPTLSDGDLSMRINNIGPLVLSRASLEPLIVQYDLYQGERQNGEPMESVVDRMKKDITIEIDKSRNDITNAFRISFRERDPIKTRMVTARLADKYVSEQIKGTGQGAAMTKEFFEQQLKETKEQLDEVDRQRLKYMTEHVNSLPSGASNLATRLNGLREQQKSLSSEMGRLQDSRTAQSNQLNDLTEDAKRANTEIAEQKGDVKTSPAYGQLVLRKATLDAELKDMLTTLKPQNPDVKSKQAQFDSIAREMKQMEEDAKANIEELRRKRAGNVDLRISGLKSNIQLIEGELKRKEMLLEQNTREIAEVEQRLNDVPTSEVALEALNREYQTKKTNYDDLLKKASAIKLGVDVATNEQGEKIQVIDPASLPQRPVAPKRTALMLLGVVLGLGAGLGFAAVFEVPRLLTIQTTDDAEHYTGLPVLISVPELLTPLEERRNKQRRILLIAAGIIATIVSIPVLALALRATHILNRFVS